MAKPRKSLRQYGTAIWRGLRSNLINVVAVLTIPLGIVMWMRFRRPSSDLSFWESLEPSIGLVTLFFLVITWLVRVVEMAESDEPIKIILVTESERMILPYRPLRSVLSRAEIQGILSMYYGPLRYDAKFIRRAVEAPADGELSPLELVVRGTSDTLEIKVDADFMDKVRNQL